MAEKTEEKKKNLPVAKYRKGRISVAKFVNEREGPNGTFTSNSYNFQRGVKVGDDWVNQDMNVFENEIDDLLALLLRLKQEQVQLIEDA